MAITQPPAPACAALLDRPEPLDAGAGHIRRITVDDPVDPFAVPDEIANRAPVSHLAICDRRVKRGEIARENVDPCEIEIAHDGFGGDSPQIVGVDRAGGEAREQIRLVAVANRHQRAVRRHDAKIQCLHMLRHAPEVVERLDHSSGAVGASIVTELVRRRRAPHELAPVAAPVDEADSHRQPIPRNLLGRTGRRAGVRREWFDREDLFAWIHPRQMEHQGRSQVLDRVHREPMRCNPRTKVPRFGRSMAIKGFRNMRSYRDRRLGDRDIDP